MSDQSYIINGQIVEEVELSLRDLSRSCQVDAEWLLVLIDEGVLEPLEPESPWRFSGISIRRVRTVQRLQKDLGVNIAGAALVLDLLAEVDALKTRLAVLETGE